MAQQPQQVPQEVAQPAPQQQAPQPQEPPQQAQAQAQSFMQSVPHAAAMVGATLGANVIAAAHGLEDMATMGLGDQAIAHLQSMYNGKTPAENYRRIQDVVAAAHAFAPQSTNVTSAVGQGVGMFTGAEGLGMAAKGLSAVPGVGDLLGPASTSLGNMGKAAAAGAVGGGVTAAAHNGSAADVALNAGVGGVAGPLAGAVAEGVAKAASGPINKGWRILAKKLGVSADDIAAKVAEHKALTGKAPSIATIADEAQLGNLRGLAQKNNTMSGTLGNEARRLQNTKGVAGLEEARDNAMTAAMSSIRDTPVKLPTDLLEDPQFNRAVPRALRGKVADAVDNGGNGLTIGEADTIRRKLRQLNNSPANIGENYGEIADELAGHVSKQSAGYAAALHNYTRASNEIAGHQHGLSGGSLANLPPDLQTRLRGPFGTDVNRGFNEGRHHFETSRGTRVASGGNVEEKTVDASGHFTAGLAEAALGAHIGGANRLARGVSKLVSSESLSPKVQQTLARAIIERDPVKVDAVIAQLRKAKASEKALGVLRNLSAALAGIATSSKLHGG